MKNACNHFKLSQIHTNTAKAGKLCKHTTWFGKPKQYIIESIDKRIDKNCDCDVSPTSAVSEYRLKNISI